MGPNGSGKSTLARALSGHPAYEVTGGEITYDGKDLLAMAPEDRAREGVFMAFQYPVEIAGINNAYFLKAALNAVKKHRGEQELDAVEFMQLIREKAKQDVRSWSFFATIIVQRTQERQAIPVKQQAAPARRRISQWVAQQAARSSLWAIVLGLGVAPLTFEAAHEVARRGAAAAVAAALRQR